MERAAHEPCLDERLAFSQRVSNVLDPAFDPNAGLKLRRGHDLGLNASNVTDHPSHVFFRSASQ
jgi:hypothetical protein